MDSLWEQVDGVITLQGNAIKIIVVTRIVMSTTKQLNGIYLCVYCTMLITVT